MGRRGENNNNNIEHTVRAGRRLTTPDKATLREEKSCLDRYGFPGQANLWGLYRTPVSNNVAVVVLVNTDIIRA